MVGINSNIASMNSQRTLAQSSVGLNQSMQRLSSGLRINSSKDDAAGLSIANKMDAQIRGMSAATRNANDGISLAQTADGALSVATVGLQRMRELAVQGANGTNTTEDSASLDAEFQELAAEIDRIAKNTQFNGSDILTTAAVDVDIQIGANSGQKITIVASDLETIAGTLTGDLTDVANSTTALDTLDTALTDINKLRANLGATENRLGMAIDNLAVGVETQTAAKSRITDTDFAAETAKLSRSQVLQQAGTAMVAQANQLPQGVLALLR